MNEDALILSVDTATPGGGVCLLRGRQVLASSSGDAALSHSNTLLRDIDAILKNADFSLDEVDVFAAASGPGSFTGLRIGLATVKGLAATLERPCIGVPTLHAVARSAGPSPATVALLAAGRGELFAQLLSVSDTFEITERDAPAHLPPAAVIEKYGEIGQLLWAGPGAQTQLEFLRAAAKERNINFDEGASGWRVAATPANLAVEIAMIAGEEEISDTMMAEHLHALYVRPSDPELKNANT
jgi:tRNA threonylcarbamoyladenosine biosynthesis protein TsaB